MQKLNKKSNKLWQKPRQSHIHWLDEDWYEPRCVGHTPLKKFMKTLIKNARLETDIYTNHSIRATCIGTLDDNGFEARHITAISSHKNESTIKTYSTKCPEKKKREMYEALNAAVVPKKAKINAPATVSKPPAPQDNFPTINMDHLLPQENMEIAENQKQNSAKLPPTFELMPFEDDEDDDFLLQYLHENPSENALVPVTKAVNITTSNNTMATSMPIVPKMFFPNSNVTINYNFSK